MSPTPSELRTERLVLRRWRAADRDPFAALNADPVVMEHFVACPTRAESDDLVDRVEDPLRPGGLGPLGRRGRRHRAPSSASPASGPPPSTPTSPRRSRSVGAWPRKAGATGYATEAARASVADGFQRFGFDEIVSMTSVGNTRSRRVMEKLGMTRDPADDFDHPNVPAGHRIRRHVLYRLPAP